MLDPSAEESDSCVALSLQLNGQLLYCKAENFFLWIPVRYGNNNENALGLMCLKLIV